MPARDRVRNNVLVSTPISKQEIITISNGRPVELMSAVDVIGLDTGYRAVMMLLLMKGEGIYLEVFLV